ncbi:MAG: hypothetical protein FWC84_07135 [Alphaproteobacteria bacterium]|nr:hypothetical protein [Alphaproteobacteria bacterium]
MGRLIVFPRLAERNQPRLPLGKPAKVIPFTGRWHGLSLRLLPEPPTASEIAKEPLPPRKKFIEPLSKLWRGLKAFCQAVDRPAKAGEPVHRSRLLRASEGKSGTPADQKVATWSGDHPLAS